MNSQLADRKIRAERKMENVFAPIFLSGLWFMESFQLQPQTRMATMNRDGSAEHRPAGAAGFLKAEPCSALPGTD
jgi:hypothetical protein